MAVVLADVIELAGRALARLFQQRGFLELSPHRTGCPRHRLDVGEADLAVGDRLEASGHPLEVLADSDQVTRDVTGDMTVESDPIDGSREAMIVVLLGRGRTEPPTEP